MLLIKSDNRYTIRYIGGLREEDLARLLLVFRLNDKEEQLLFESFSADPYFWDEDIIADEKEHYYESFLDDSIGFHLESTESELRNKVQCILLEAIGEYNNESVAIVDLFISGELDVKADIVEKIKATIYETVVLETKPHIDRFLQNKVVFMNNTWFDMSNDSLKTSPLAKVRWFSAQTIPDIIDAINLTEVYFKVLVHSKENAFGEYAFALVYYEAESDFHLEIIETTAGSFENMVVPVLKKEFSNIIISL